MRADVRLIEVHGSSAALAGMRKYAGRGAIAPRVDSSLGQSTSGDYLTTLTGTIAWLDYLAEFRHAALVLVRG
jgi:hypothetical protein